MKTKFTVEIEEADKAEDALPDQRYLKIYTDNPQFYDFSGWAKEEACEDLKTVIDNYDNFVAPCALAYRELSEFYTEDQSEAMRLIKKMLSKTKR